MQLGPPLCLAIPRMETSMDAKARSRRLTHDASLGFIAGACRVCDNLGIKSCKTGADVPVRHGKTVLGKGTQ
jgi:hypothetical protein